MPVRHARSETRGRPPFGRRGGVGKNGSTRSHNGSGSSASAIPVRHFDFSIEFESKPFHQLERLSRHLIPFNPSWSADILRGALNHRDIENGTLHEIYLDEKHVEQVKPVLREVFPGFKAELFGRSGAGQTVRRLGFENSIGPDYFRGLAKIALHGALRLMPEWDGHAWEFDTRGADGRK